VLESTPGRLIRFPIAPDGSAGEREILAELSGAVPDGIALMTDGSAVIACYRPDMILRWRADRGLHVLAHDSEGKALADQLCVLWSTARPDRRPEHRTVACDCVSGRGPVGVPLFYPTAEQLGG